MVGHFHSEAEAAPPSADSTWRSCTFFSRIFLAVFKGQGFVSSMERRRSGMAGIEPAPPLHYNQCCNPYYGPLLHYNQWHGPHGEGVPPPAPARGRRHAFSLSSAPSRLWRGWRAHGRFEPIPRIEMKMVFKATILIGCCIVHE